MASVIYFFEPMAWLLLLAACFFCLGRTILVLVFNLPVKAASFFLSSVMGMSWVILALFVLLLTNSLTTVTALLVTALPTVLIFSFKPDLILCRWGFDRLTRYYALIAVVMAFWLSVAIRVYLPESGHDALSYHLPYAKSFAEQGGLTLEQYLRYPLNTLNFDLLFTLGYLFQGEILARMFSVYATLLLLIGIYSFGLLNFNAYVATIATWIFISSQLILNIMHMAYIDIGFALFVFAAVVALIEQQKMLLKGWLLALAVYLGVALGTKYLGLLVVPSMICWLFFVLKQKKLLIAVGLIVLVVGSPWYIRNTIISGNPIHPFLQNIFGFWLWTPTDLEFQNADLYAVHGVARNWLNFIKLPVLIWQDTFVRIGPTNVLYALSLPISILGLFKAGIIRQLSIFILFHLLFWFFSSQIMRYFIFVLPLLSLVIAYYLYQTFHLIWGLLTNPKLTKQKKQHLFGWLVTVICMASSIKYHHKVVSQDIAPSSQHEWRTKLMEKPLFQLVDAANQQENKTTLVLGFSQAAHYFKHDFKGDYYGTANMVEFAKNAINAEQAHKLMKNLSSELLLIEKRHKIFVDVHHVVENSEFFDLILENPVGYLYQLK